MTNVIDVARFSRVATNGIHLHIAEAGSRDGGAKAQEPVCPVLCYPLPAGAAVDFLRLTQSFKDVIVPEAFTPNALREYRAAWSQPGAITSMLYWYRALLRKPMPPSGQLRVRGPTLVIPKISLRGANWPMPVLGCATTLAYFERSTHWVQHDEPERVGDLLLEFLNI